MMTRRELICAAVTVPAFWTRSAEGQILTPMLKGQTFDLYVDSAHGSDSNSGRSPALAKQTIGSVANSWVQNILTGNWFTQFATIAATAIRAPFGSSVAPKLTEDTSNATHRLVNLFGGVAGAYTASIFARAGERTWMHLRFGASYGNFNLATGVLGTTSAGDTAQITAVGGGWYYCALYCPSLASNSLPWFYLAIADVASADTSYTGNGTSGLYLWGERTTAGNALTMQVPISQGMSIGLRGGSVWREQLSVLDNYVTVAAYGGGAKPLLDASDAISSGAWSLSAGMTFTYQASVTFAALAGFVRMWETGVGLTLATSLLNCEATAGTYYYASAPNAIAALAQTLYVHPTGSGNPSTNGKVYEFNSRAYGIVADGVTYTNCIFSGLWTRRNGANNGSVEMGQYGTLQNHLAEDGFKHCVYVSGGCKLFGVEAHNIYYAGQNSNLIILFGTATGQGLTMANCWAHNDTYVANTVGIFNHLGSGTSWGTFVGSNLRFDNLLEGFEMNNFGGGVTINGGSSTGCNLALMGWGALTVQNFAITCSTLTGSCCIAMQVGGSVNFVNCTLTAPSGAAATIYGATNQYASINVSACTLASAAVTNVLATPPSSGTTLTISGTKFTGSAASAINVDTSRTTVSSDFNDYTGVTSTLAFIVSTVTKTYSQWKALGYDTHSLP